MENKKIEGKKGPFLQKQRRPFSGTQGRKIFGSCVSQGPHLRKYKKLDLVDVFNESINNTLSRTLMTSITTLIALFSLFIFGGEVIKPFAFAMIIGIVIGTYSSIYIAVPTLLLFKFRPQDEDSN